MKRNNAIPSNHFKKTSLKFKTWFDQPAKAKKRKALRKARAEKMAPMPASKLRPVVRCPTIRHNRKVRLGRGFTPEECRTAGVDYRYARTVGISVDLRRVNQNEESFTLNVARIKEYVSKLTFYNTRAEARQAGAVQHVGAILPIPKIRPTVESISVAELAAYN